MWPFKRKSLVPGEPRSGITTVQSPPFGVRLYGGTVVPYDQLYRDSPAVRAVIDFLAMNIGQVPLAGFIRSGTDERTRLERRDPLMLLLTNPNRRASGFELRRDTAADLALHGNAFWLMVRDDDGEVGALVRIPPGITSIAKNDSTEIFEYRVQFAAGPKSFPAADVVHFRAYSPDGLIGTSPLESLRGVLAEDDAAVKNREGFWRNAARQEGVIERPLDAPEWGEDARRRFREDWQAVMSGAAAAGKTGILEDGMKWNGAAFSPRDSEYIAGRKLTLSFVASVFDVPLQLLGGTDRNVDAAQRGLLTNTLAPWLSWVEETVNRTLVPAVHGEQSVYGRIFTEHVLEEKTRGSFRVQAEILEKSVGGPWLTPNEARALLNLPPIADGDHLYYPPSILMGSGGGETQ